ncbi:MAG: ABC transporter ATP-binding protein [Rhodospirillales bacterium]|nr:MAG: ABC transporter ATP-binding protein [Rhodospirillales bacterium]
MLEIQNLSAHYGRIRALDAVSLEIGEGELVSLVGANGAGKTTLLRVISGIGPVSAGRVMFDDRDITRLPADSRVRLGIVQVPEGRQVFAPMRVEENLLIGGYTRTAHERAEALARQYERFPALAAARDKPAGMLSGGQQQMLAVARALMGRPRLLLLDEPSLGLAPRLVDEVFDAVTSLRDSGVTVFLVEQNAFQALSIADRGYVMETGQVVLADTGKALLTNERVKAAYLGL